MISIGSHYQCIIIQFDCIPCSRVLYLEVCHVGTVKPRTVTAVFYSHRPASCLSIGSVSILCSHPYGIHPSHCAMSAPSGRG